MTEVEFECGHEWLAEQIEKHVSPRKYYLHNIIGGEGWDVRPYKFEVADRRVYGSIARFDDPKMALFIKLKI